MAAMAINRDLELLMLRSESDWLQQRIEVVSAECRARLNEAARDVREGVRCEAFGLDSGLVDIVHKLEALARGEAYDAD